MKFQRNNKKQAGAIIIDSETIPQDEARLLALAPNFVAPGNYKDADKIAANIADQKAKYIQRAALHWTTAEVVLIGFVSGSVYKPIFADGSDSCSEHDVITDFFIRLESWLEAGRKIGGHNIKGFDLPLIVNRARVLGVPLPDGLLTYWNGRPTWNELIFDTLEEISFGPYNTDGNGVDDVCRAFGIPGKTGTGAEFPSLWKSDREAAIAYNRNDCTIEKAIAERLGFKF